MTKRAQRREAEAAADRACFELARDRVIFGVGLAAAAAMLVVATLVMAFNPELIPVTLASGGGIGGLLAFFKGKPARD